MKKLLERTQVKEFLISNPKHANAVQQ